jgi:hypothetical protein
MALSLPLLYPQRAFGDRQQYGLHGGSLEGIKRLSNAQINFRGFMVPGLATVDLGMDGRQRGSPNLVEACLRAPRSIGRVVMGRVNMRIAAAVECIEGALDILSTIEVYNPEVLGNIATVDGVAGFWLDELLELALEAASSQA